jgi:phenylalanyl-tRNA synthetase beta chain
MPTLTYDKKDLLKLVDRELNDKALVEAVEAIKPGVEMVGQEIVVEHCVDRADLFGVEGLARAVRHYLGIKPGLAKYKVKKSGLTVAVSSVPVRPFIACAIVKNVKLEDASIKSLMNIQEILHETVGRKRKKVAIGVHDFDKIKPPISYLGVSRESKMVPLEFSEEMSLEEVLKKTLKGRGYGVLIESARLWPVLMDRISIFSFPPIINSDRTKVTEKTRSLFIDVTGTNREAVLQALNILVTNLAERGCKLESVRMKYKKKVETTPNLAERAVEVDKSYVNNLLGTNLEEKEMVKLLRRMGYDAIGYGEKIQVIVPAYRSDVLHPADIAEDLAIAYGYNNFTPVLPNLSTSGRPDRLEKLSSRARELMVGLGFQEVIRPILTNAEEQFDKMCINRQKTIELENPVSRQYDCMRVWILPSLLEVLAANKHVEYPQKLFEVGDTVLPAEEETKSKDVRKVAAVLSHSRASFVEIKSVVERFLKDMKVKHAYRKSNHPSFIPGRVCEILTDKVVGYFGELHPRVLEKWKLEMPVAAFEVELPS